MPGGLCTRSSVWLCAALGASGCLSAPEDAGGGQEACGTAASLRDDFEVDAAGVAAHWDPVFFRENFETAGGRLRFLVPAENLEAVIRSRGAFRLADGQSVRVDVAAWPALDTFIALDGVTQEQFLFYTGGDTLQARAPLGTMGDIDRAGVTSVRFQRAGNVVTLQASRGGEVWEDLVFEPWVDELAVLRISVMGSSEVSGEVLELDGVNTDVERAPWCGVAELAADFDAPPPDLLDEWDDLGCHLLDGATLALGAACYIPLARSHSLEGAGVEARVWEGAMETSQLFLNAQLADGTLRTLVWRPGDATYQAPGGIRGTLAAASLRMRFVHRDGALVAQLFAEDAWVDIGADPVDDELLRDVKVILSAGGDGVHVEELRGSSE